MAKQTFTTGQVLTAAQMTSLQQTAMLGGSASAKTASHTLVAADAGTFITMSSTSSTTITVNTGLFAAGDIVTILNTNSGTCTITAGTATVSKPTNVTLALAQNEGGVLYFTATGAATFMEFSAGSAASPLTTKGDLYGFSTLDARIPIGANNTVLTADSAQTLGLKWAAISSTFVGASAYKSTNQSLSNNTNTAVTFDTENYDTDSFHSNVTNNTRFTIPSGKAGKYLITGTMSFASDTTGYREVMLYKNGAISNFLAKNYPVQTSGTNVNFNVVVNLAVNDYIEIYVIQTSGTTMNLQGTSGYSEIQLSYLGA